MTDMQAMVERIVHASDSRIIVWYLECCRHVRTIMTSRCIAGLSQRNDTPQNHLRL